MSRMMIYINYPLSSQLTKFVTVTLTFVTVSYIVSYVRNQPESYTLTSLGPAGAARHWSLEHYVEIVNQPTNCPGGALCGCN